MMPANPLDTVQTPKPPKLLKRAPLTADWLRLLEVLERPDLPAGTTLSFPHWRDFQRKAWERICTTATFGFAFLSLRSAAGMLALRANARQAAAEWIVTRIAKAPLQPFRHAFGVAILTAGG